MGEKLDTEEEYREFISWFRELQTTEKGRILDELAYIYHEEIGKLRHSNQLVNYPSCHKKPILNFVTPRNSRGRLSISDKGINIEQVKTDYSKTKSLRKTAKIHNISYESVRRILKKS